MTSPVEPVTSSQPAPAAARSSASNEDRSARRAVTVFPLLVLASFAVAMLAPDTFKPLAQGTNIALGVIMFGMGLTLTLPDFALVAKRSLPVLIGVVAQYVIMPGLAVALTWAFQLPEAVAVGVILVGCAPGGTSSNVISYLSRADVALSVTMTSISTLIAPIMTPILTQWLAGEYMPVDAGAMALSIVKMVLVPVIGGLVVRSLFGSLVAKILPVLPWVSVLGICYVVMAVVSNSASKIASAGLIVLGVVVCHNLLGYLLGYFAGRLGGGKERTARTTSIEVGMQNSGLAATLAAAHFASTPETALPGAVFSVWHNLSGAVLALYYRHRDKTPATRAVVEH